MEEVKTHSTKKTYLEAALTPSTTPNNSPQNVYVINNKIKTGIIDIRLKWYTNNNNDDEICYFCKKGILEDEWNSYYTVYVKRYKNIMNEYKKTMVLDNIDARQKEIAGYEVNIFNYQYIYDNSTDEEFKQQVCEGIISNTKEMNKTKLVLEALEAQLKTL